MAELDRREKDIEDRFAHDEEVRLQVHAARNHMLGLWAAEKLGLSGDAADSYAARLTQIDVPRFRDEETIASVASDFRARGVALGAEDVRRELDRLLPAALRKFAATLDMPL